MKTVRTIRSATADGRRVDIELRVDDRFHLSSASSSSLDEMIEAAGDIDPELVEVLPYARALRGTDGLPVHCAANAEYHLTKADLRSARQTLLVADDAELETLAGRVAFAVEARKAFAADFAEGATAKLRERVRDEGMRDASAVSALGRNEASVAGLYERNVFEAAELTRTDRAATDRLSQGARMRLEAFMRERGQIASKAAAEARRLIDPVSEWIEENRERYTAIAAKLRSAIARPDVETEAYVRPEDDWSTFVGFANLAGIEMDLERKMDGRDGRRNYAIELSLEGRTFTTEFSMGSAAPGDPTVGHILESLHFDCRAANETFEDYCAEFGIDSDSIANKKMHDQCVVTYDRMQGLLGDALFSHFTARVGDEYAVPDVEGPLTERAQTPGL